MSFKAILFCAQALLIQAISSQCIGAYNGLAEGYGWGAAPYAAEAWAPCMAEVAAPWGSEYAAPLNAEYSPWNTGARLRAAEFEAVDSRFAYGGLAPATVAASNGGGLAVTSSSPIAPSGLSVVSENAIEGPLAVTGEIPFLGAVALEGALPTAGSGGVAYGCGNGNVAILNEDLAYNNGYGYGAYAPGLAGAGLGAPLANGYAAGLAGPAAYGFNRGCGCGRI